MKVFSFLFLIGHVDASDITHVVSFSAETLSMQTQLGFSSLGMASVAVPVEKPVTIQAYWRVSIHYSAIMFQPLLLSVVQVFLSSCLFSR